MFYRGTAKGQQKWWHEEIDLDYWQMWRVGRGRQITLSLRPANNSSINRQGCYTEEPCPKKTKAEKRSNSPERKSLNNWRELLKLWWGCSPQLVAGREGLHFLCSLTTKPGHSPVSIWATEIGLVCFFFSLFLGRGGHCIVGWADLGGLEDECIWGSWCGVTKESMLNDMLKKGRKKKRKKECFLKDFCGNVSGNRSVSRPAGLRRGSYKK